MAPLPRGGSRARLAQLQQQRALAPHRKRQRTRREPAEHARTKVDTERRQLLTLRIASDQPCDGRLPGAAAALVMRIEGDQWNEELAASSFQDSELVERHMELQAKFDALHRGDCRDSLALPDRTGKEGADFLILIRAGV